METDSNFKSGFVGIIGAPNAGKSTLLNQILGQKIAITSDKPQTTRHKILGVWTNDKAQVIFMDTPGIHHARDLLNRELVTQALSVLAEVDLILFLTEPKGRKEDESLVIDEVKASKKPVVLAINKIDKVNKPELLPIMDHFNKTLDPAAIIPISALKNMNITNLMDELINNLPNGPLYYPPDALTDQVERFIAAEMIREQVFRRTGQEIPYSTAVTVEEFLEDPELIRIQAVIHLERETQKKIVIGKNGAKLKEIGTAARLDIERMTGTKVFLKLFVRIQKNWSKDPQAIREFGYKPS